MQGGCAVVALRETLWASLSVQGLPREAMDLDAILARAISINPDSGYPTALSEAKADARAAGNGDPMACVKALGARKGREDVQEVLEAAGLTTAHLSGWTPKGPDPRRFCGIMPPLEALVAANLDSTENLDVLFGDARLVMPEIYELRAAMRGIDAFARGPAQSERPQSNP